MTHSGTGEIPEGLLEASNEEKRLENEIEKHTAKLKFYAEQVEELIEENDQQEMEITISRMNEIYERILNLISTSQEMKIERGGSDRQVRQWKKDKKTMLGQFLEERNKLSLVLKNKQEQEAQNKEREIMREEMTRAKLEQDRLTEIRKQQSEFEEQAMRQRYQLEKDMWEKKFKAEIEMIERKTEIQRKSHQSQAKLPKLQITPFNGTPMDWVRFENMFTTQVHDKEIADEVKFGYLLEMISPQVRDKIGNLKPGTIGYNTAWERLKREYGQIQVVVNAHVTEIINLSQVKGTNHERVNSFYEKISKSFDALQTLGKADILSGLVMTTLNKLPQVKPDIVRTDEEWERWTMADLVKNLEKWLKRNKPEESAIATTASEKPKRERHWFVGGEGASQNKETTRQGPHCIFCKQSHWGDSCQVYDTLEKRRKFFKDGRLCFNCGKAGHRENKCRSRGCIKCKARHHTSLCDKGDRESDTVLNAYSPQVQEKSLPPIVPVKIKGQTFWAHLDTGSSKDFISSDAARKLNLKPERYVTRNIMTVNGVKKQSLPIFSILIHSVDGQTKEKIEVTGASVSDFTTVKRPDLSELKQKYSYMRDKQFYTNQSGEHQIHLILGDSTYCRIKTEEIYKGQPEEPIVEGTTFGYIVHGGEGNNDNTCLYTRDTRDYEKLYCLDVLGVEDRGEDDPSDVYKEFVESITKDKEGRYEVGIPWIAGAEVSESNEQQSRIRLKNVEKKLQRNPELDSAYKEIIKDQLSSSIVEKAPESPTGNKVFYLPHKPVCRDEAATTKVRMVFDASARPSPVANSINECMYTGPALQPHLWDILIRARMSANLLIGDLQKAFLQIGLKTEDRDAFRFLFNINGREEHLRFARIPFGAEASPFILGATLLNHYDQQPEKYRDTVAELKRNTYVDNLMKTSNTLEELERFKIEATDILTQGHFPVHKWESNIRDLESENMSNPSKILGYTWDKVEDTLEIKSTKYSEERTVTKREMLSYLGSIYDPLGIISPTLVEGKHLYREACDQNNEWNKEVSSELAITWHKWTRQLRDIKIPRSIIKENKTVKAIHIHIFADASNKACSTVAFALIEQKTQKIIGLLTSKSRISKRNTSISRLELVSGQMAANLVKNLSQALKHLPITSINVWMDSMVALYWITNPRKQWKTFVLNRVSKIATVTKGLNVSWKYCPTDINIADLGSRGASIDKIERENWFTGPEWLLDQQSWPVQPMLKVTKSITDEEKPRVESIMYNKDKEPDEWGSLLDRKSYWTTLRVTAWALRFYNNCKAKRNKANRSKGPLTTLEIQNARNYLTKRAQRNIPETLQRPGWRLEKDQTTGILRCKGRVESYQPMYLEDGEFARKLVRYQHEAVGHLGVASTMAALRENWHILHMRALVKKTVRNCNICKVFSAKPFKGNLTAPLPKFRTEVSRPFQFTGVDFAGPVIYKTDKKEDSKAYIVIFTCATMRAVHLELTKTQSAEEFRQKLNAFITRRTRPRMMISDNGGAFKATAEWIRKLRKSERLQDYLSQQEIQWKFNMSKAPWWGAMYERIIKDMKRVLYKTLGKTHLKFEQLETVVLDIERHLNNRPLTYVECDVGEEKVLTPNSIMWGQDAHIIEDLEIEEDSLTKLDRRLKTAREHVWRRWSKEYVKSLMDQHRTTKIDAVIPKVGEIVLLVGEEKNCGIWKKGRVKRLIKGSDGVVRGAVVLHNGREIQRPLQLMCSLEIRSATEDGVDSKGNNREEEPEGKNGRGRPRRDAAGNAKLINQMILEEED